MESLLRMFYNNLPVRTGQRLLQKFQGDFDLYEAKSPDFIIRKADEEGNCTYLVMCPTQDRYGYLDKTDEGIVWIPISQDEEFALIDWSIFWYQDPEYIPVVIDSDNYERFEEFIPINGQLYEEVEVIIDPIQTGTTWLPQIGPDSLGLEGESNDMIFDHCSPLYHSVFQYDKNDKLSLERHRLFQYLIKNDLVEIPNDVTDFPSDSFRYDEVYWKIIKNKKYFSCLIRILSDYVNKVVIRKMVTKYLFWDTQNEKNMKVEGIPHINTFWELEDGMTFYDAYGPGAFRQFIQKAYILLEENEYLSFTGPYCINGKNKPVKCKSVMDYLFSWKKQGYDSMEVFIQEWDDTLRMQKDLYGKIKKRFPYNLKELHARLYIRFQTIYEKVDDELFQEAIAYNREYDWEDEEYIIRSPISQEEMILESIGNQNCVSSYRKRVADCECYIFFLRKKENPDAPYVTVEVDKYGYVVQARGRFNRNVDYNEYQEICKWAEHSGFHIKINYAA